MMMKLLRDGVFSLLLAIFGDQGRGRKRKTKRESERKREVDQEGLREEFQN